MSNPRWNSSPTHHRVVPRLRIRLALPLRVAIVRLGVETSHPEILKQLVAIKPLPGCVAFRLNGDVVRIRPKVFFQHFAHAVDERGKVVTGEAHCGYPACARAVHFLALQAENVAPICKRNGKKQTSYKAKKQTSYMQQAARTLRHKWPAIHS